MQKINIDKEFVISMTESGHTPKEIGDILGVNECTIRNRLKEYGVTRVRKLFQITPEIMNSLKRFNKEGKTNQQIADILHISPITVRKYISKMSLKFNSERTQPINKTVIALTEEQREVLYGSLLGDMSISINWKNARPSISQGGQQKEYFLHKCHIFQNLIGQPSTNDRYDKRTKKWYHKYTVKFLAHPFYTQLYHQLYINGTKTITQEWLNQLTDRSLAYWFMDDGCNCGTLATNCFSVEECKLVQKWLYNKYGIETTLPMQGKHRDQPVIYIRVNSRRLFYSIVFPYFIPSMYYKLEGWNRKPRELRETH